jgi:beta-glucanase (GH16 family)
MKTTNLIIILLLFISVKAQISPGKEIENSNRSCDSDMIATLIGDYPDCYPNYILVFEDDFEGAFLDQSKWTPRVGPVRGWDPETYTFKCDNGKTPQWYRPENVNVEDGKLILTSDNWGLMGSWYVQWDPPLQQTRWFDYTSGEIDSKRRFHHGYFEMRCKLPETRGFNPAFWIFGDPIWSEIDFFEINTSTHEHTMTVHYDFTNDGNSEYCPSTYSFSDFNNMHTYGCEWTPFHITFYVDGNEKWRYYHFWNNLPQPIDCHNIHSIPVLLNSKKLWPLEPGEIIANLGVWCNGNKPDATTVFPSTYEIEYIKYWMDIKNPDPLVISNTLELSLNDRYYNTAAGQYVLFKDNVSLHENDQLEVLAIDYIDLLPGVEFEDASIVSLRIEDDMNTNSTLKSGQNYYQSNKTQDMPKVNGVISESASKLHEALNQNFDFKIYPNPSDGRCISVRLPFKLDCTIDVSIINSMGVETYRKRCVSSEILILNNLSLTTGLYLFNISIVETGLAKAIKLIVE